MINSAAFTMGCVHHLLKKHNTVVNIKVSLWLFSLELVLKVRIQNPNARENDFIEVELDRQELTYRSLLRVCCRELDISAEHVEKIRKLPNTMLRKVQYGRESPHTVHCTQVFFVAVQCCVHKIRQNNNYLR